MLHSCCYLVNSITSYADIDLPILSLLGGMSIIDWLFTYCCSIRFKFCVYHRLPLYYILINDLVTYYDIYGDIPLDARFILNNSLILFGVMMMLIIILKFKVCKR